MATTPRVRAVPAKAKRTSEEKAYIAAVLSGIYASSGQAILSLENHEYSLAFKNARKVAVDQARVVVRGPT